MDEEKEQTKPTPDKKRKNLEEQEYLEALDIVESKWQQYTIRKAAKAKREAMIAEKGTVTWIVLDKKWETTPSCISDLAQEFKLEYSLDNSPICGLDLKEEKFGKNTIRYEFYLPRKLIAAVGCVRVMPISNNAARVKIICYERGPDLSIGDEWVKLYYAALDFFTGLAEYLKREYEEKVTPEKTEHEEAKEGGKRTKRGKRQQIANRQSLMFELHKKNPTLSQLELADEATQEAFDREQALMKKAHPNWRGETGWDVIREHVRDEYGDVEFTVDDVKYDFRGGKW